MRNGCHEEAVGVARCDGVRASDGVWADCAASGDDSGSDLDSTANSDRDVDRCAARGGDPAGDVCVDGCAVGLPQEWVLYRYQGCNDRMAGWNAAISEPQRGAAQIECVARPT